MAAPAVTIQLWDSDAKLVGADGPSTDLPVDDAELARVLDGETLHDVVEHAGEAYARRFLPIELEDGRHAVRVLVPLSAEERSATLTAQKRIVHDINNALSIVLNLTLVAARMSNDERQRELLTSSHEAARRAADLAAELVRISRVSPAPPAPAAAEPAPRGHGETVLVVEDSRAVRAMVCGFLARNGYRVLEAGGAAEAVRAARAYEAPIALLLTDVSMPELPGPALAEKLIAARPGLRVLYMSGQDAATVAALGILPHRFELIAKPFGEPDLLQRVRRVLDSS